MARPRYNLQGERIDEQVPEPRTEPVAVAEAPRIKVKREAPPEPQVELNEDAAKRLVNSMVDTPDNRLPEMTYLSKTMAFLISLQSVMKPEYIMDDKVDIIELWEKRYYQLQRSVGGEHLDRLSRLTEIQMAGSADDIDSLGDMQ